jgi:hypothetical protein
LGGEVLLDLLHLGCGLWQFRVIGVG